MSNGLNFLPLVATVVSVTLGPAIFGAPAVRDAPDPDKVYIKSVAYAGSGCPDGTVAASLDDDRKTMTLSFDSFIASVGPDVPTAENRKRCNISISLTHPPAYKYTLNKATFTGFIDLEKKVTATQQSEYFFVGYPRTTSFIAEWTGPVARDYRFIDKLTPSSMTWSPCGENPALQVHAAIRLNSNDKSKSGLMTVDTIDGKARMITDLTWQKCSSRDSKSLAESPVAAR